MSKILNTDDLSKDMFVTVYQGALKEKITNTPMGPEISHIEDKYLNGSILKISAIDAPYVIVDHYTAHNKSSSRSLDLRLVKLSTISSEYIKAMFPKIDIKVAPIETSWAVEREEKKQDIKHS